MARSNRPNATDIRSIVIDNPKIVGNSAGTNAFVQELTAVTLESGLRVKNDDGSSSMFIGITGAQTAIGADTTAYKLNAGEEIFLEVRNTDLVFFKGNSVPFSFMGN